MSEMPSASYEPPRNPNQLGGVDKKWWIIGGVGAVAIVWYAYHRSASSASSGSTTAGIDPQTGLPYSQTPSSGYIDPTTGYSYASEYTAPYPQGSVDPNTGIPYALEGPIDPTTGIPYSQETGSTTTTTPTPTPSASSWLSGALSSLEANGVATSHAQQVLGAYLSGQSLTPDEVSIVEQAVGSAGPAPGSPSIHTVTAPSSQGTASRTIVKTKPDVPVPYTAVKGDTLAKIEKRFKVTLAELRRMNPRLRLTSKSKVHRGEVIKV